MSRLDRELVDRGLVNSRSRAAQWAEQRLLARPAFGTGGLLDLTSSFRDLAELWLEDLALQKLSEGTKENYRDDLRLHVLPQFEHFTLGEITTGRVEWFLRSEAAVSFSRAKHSRTMLNLLFGFALRHDAIPRNPVQGTSPLRRPKGEPQALTVDQITAIRTERGLAGKVMTADGLLVIRWILPSGTEIDSGVRADDKSVYPRWVAAFDTQTDTEQRNDQ